MIRVGPEQYEDALKQKHCREMDLTGHPLKGLVFVDTEGYQEEKDLAQWIQCGLRFTKTLPKK